MNSKECIAMILAGGRGKRLGALTNYYSKPAVYYGGNHRIIDFALSNCKNSGIHVIGFLSQYFSLDLQVYIQELDIYNNEKEDGKIMMLPSNNKESEYTGTANAVYQNIEFIDILSPKNVLILSSDHIYKMNYQEMLDFHQVQNADVTIGAIKVDAAEAHRLGILDIDNNSLVRRFEEKPNKPKGTMASMGIYIFKWEVLRRMLIRDNMNLSTQHDFGKNIIPNAIHEKKKVFAFQFKNYWRDVGTVYSLWKSNMDLLQTPSVFSVDDEKWKILSCHGNPRRLDIPFEMPVEMRSNKTPRSLFDDSAISRIKGSIVSERCSVFGSVENSILSSGVTIREGAKVVDSIIMPNAYIGKNARIYKAIIGSDAKIMDNAEIGNSSGSNYFVDSQICFKGVSLVAPWTYIPENLKFSINSHIDNDFLQYLGKETYGQLYYINKKPERCSGKLSEESNA